MQIDSVVSPTGKKYPLGYTPVNVTTVVYLAPKGVIGPAILLPKESDNKTPMRRWGPDSTRTSNNAPILGSDKLDYFLSEPKKEAMLALLQEYCEEVPELQLIINWIKSGGPLELEKQISNSKLTAEDIKTLRSGRIVFQLEDGTYIHDLKSLKAIHQRLTLERVKGDGSGNLQGPLNKVHSKHMPAPIYSCNDELFGSWGQGINDILSISPEEAVIATQMFTELLETPGHNIRMSNGRYWFWGATSEMAEISKANKAIEMYFGSDQAKDLNPIKALTDIVKSVNQGAKSLGKIPEELKIVCGYISIGAGGKGRVFVGNMSELSVIKFLKNILLFYELQHRYLSFSKPYWAFASLIVAPRSGKNAVAKAKEQIFEAMINGVKPPQTITKSILHRLKIEGVPNVNGKKTNREWAQICYLALLTPDFIKTEGNNRMKPDTTPENLFAWHIGRVFAACKTMSYHYATRSDSVSVGWKDPLDSYRQNLFGSPTQAFSQIMAKVSPYLTARPDKAIWFNQTIAELAEDCPNSSLPRRWTNDQVFFLALGISQFLDNQRTAKKDK